jgi:tetratricopeptide (TPR) repeat protein
MIRRTAFTALVALIALAACERPDDQETGSISQDEVRGARENLDPGVVAALDSGNVAYRAKDYETARRYFREATEIDDGVAAAWFGVYMAELALGNDDEAEAAMERAQGLAPGASLIHPDTMGQEPAPAPGDSAP